MTSLNADAAAVTVRPPKSSGGFLSNVASMAGDGVMLLGVILLIPVAIIVLGLPLALLFRGLLELVQLF